jgi:putative transposase
MPNYIRWRVPGGTYFFTVVTYRRRPVFQNPTARRFLGRAMRGVRRDAPWETRAIVLLPDHFHAIWGLPEGDCEYSVRLARVKKDFTAAYLGAGLPVGTPTAGERAKGYRGVWQPRFWEHAIRGARDFKMHLDYIHANPVKHGLAGRPADWAWSSFHRWVKMGEYTPEWCGRVDLPVSVEYDLGEP